MLEYLKKEMNNLNSSEINSADKIISICQNFYDKPAHNMQELKNKNQKSKGDIFEHFCKLYLINCYNLKDVWLLNEIPEEVRTKLNLDKKDFGIDIIGVDNKDNYYAVQAKFRKKNNKKTCVTWKQLSTFYALCLKTGPYYKHIVFTTADYVKRIGKKDNKDITIGYNKLTKIDHFTWIDMCKETKNNEEIKENKPLSLEELRKKRLEFYSIKV